MPVRSGVLWEMVFGGLIAMLPDYAGLARFAGPTNAAPWEFTFDDNFHTYSQPALSPDGTIFLTGYKTRADGNSDSLVIGVDGTNGAIRFSVPLPYSRNIGSCGHVNDRTGATPGRDL